MHKVHKYQNIISKIVIIHSKYNSLKIKPRHGILRNITYIYPTIRLRSSATMPYTYLNIEKISVHIIYPGRKIIQITHEET